MSSILGVEGLTQQTYNILRAVRQPTSSEQEFLESRQFIFLPVEAKTLNEIVSESSEYFNRGTPNYVKSQPNLMMSKSPATTIALNPTRLFLPGSIPRTSDYPISKERRLTMIEEYSESSIQTELPNAKAIMPLATMLAQADIGFDRRMGRPLLRKECLGQVLDITTNAEDISVGRVGGGKLEVTEQKERWVIFWEREVRQLVGAMPVIVFV